MTIVAEETTYDSDSTSETMTQVLSVLESHQARSLVAAQLSSRCERVKDVLVQAIEKGMVLDMTAVGVHKKVPGYTLCTVSTIDHMLNGLYTIHIPLNIVYDSAYCTVWRI